MRVAKTSDLDALVQLEEAVFEPPWNSTQVARELESDRMALVLEASQTNRHDDIHAGDDLANDILGYAFFFPILDQAELLRIGVSPERRSQGLATKLLEAGLGHLSLRRVKSCHLEVSASNHPAIRLYQTLGFSTVGTRRAYYRDGSDARLMSKILTPPEIQSVE